MKQRLLALTLATTLLGLTSTISLGAERPNQGPPPEAIEACKNKQAGDTVSFAGRKGEMLEAVCKSRDGKLIAMPTSMPEHPPRQ